MAGFKFGLIVGGGIGFVLGSRAGREPYDRLMAKVKEMRAGAEGDRSIDLREPGGFATGDGGTMSADEAGTYPTHEAMPAR